MVWAANKNQTGWRLITPSLGFDEVMSVEQAKYHLRVDHDYDDFYIAGCIRGAIAYIENRGKILSTQTWEMLLDQFPWEVLQPIEILKHPVQSITSIKYIDSNGTQQTWSSSDYQVAAGSDPTRIYPAYGKSWPTTRLQMEAVTVRTVLGFDGNIRDDVLQAMLMLIGHFYENREAVTVIQGIVSIELPLGFKELIDNFIDGQIRIY